MACFCLVLYLSVIFFVQCVFAAPKGITKIAPENHDFFGRITSYAHPKDVPDPVPMYQQFAALAQQSNCHNYHINISVGAGGDTCIIWPGFGGGGPLPDRCMEL